MNGAIHVSWDPGAGDDATVVVRMIPGEDMVIVGTFFAKDPRVIEGEFERIEPGRIEHHPAEGDGHG